MESPQNSGRQNPNMAQVNHWRYKNRKGHGKKMYSSRRNGTGNWCTHKILGPEMVYEETKFQRQFPLI